MVNLSPFLNFQQIRRFVLMVFIVCAQLLELLTIQILWFPWRPLLDSWRKISVSKRFVRETTETNFWRRSVALCCRTVQSFPLSTFPLGMAQEKEGGLNAAARALRLLNVHELRETQDQINDLLEDARRIVNPNN